MAKSSRTHAHLRTQAASAAIIRTLTPPKVARETPGDRAYRFALGAESVLHGYATAEMSNLARGLHQVALAATSDVLNAIESGDVKSIRGASDRYAMAAAIVKKICSEADDELLAAGAALMEVTQDTIDAEAARLAKVQSKVRQS